VEGVQRGIYGLSELKFCHKYAFSVMPDLIRYPERTEKNWIPAKGMPE
jgi:hypothetical protein